jgi:phosphoribosylformylglycinamidine synthase
VIHLPVAHAEGRYAAEAGTLKDLHSKNRIVLSYSDEEGQRTPESNPNGAMENIAGICNEEGNVLGLMPHPERASEPILSPYGCNDGLPIFQSMLSRA